MADALADMSHWAEFDYLLINDDLVTAVAALERLLAAGNRALATNHPAMIERAETILASG